MCELLIAIRRLANELQPSRGLAFLRRDRRRPRDHGAAIGRKALASPQVDRRFWRAEQKLVRIPDIMLDRDARIDLAKGLNGAGNRRLCQRRVRLCVAALPFGRLAQVLADKL